MWIGSLPLAQIELFTRRVVHRGQGAGRLLVVEKSRLVLMGRFAIQRSLISRRMKEVFWLNCWSLCASFYCERLHGTLGICAWKAVLPGRAPFVFGPVNILPQPDLPELSAVPLLSLPPFSFLFALLRVRSLMKFSFHSTCIEQLLSPSFSRDERKSPSILRVYFLYVSF